MCVLLLGVTCAAGLPAAGRERVFETVLASLAYGPSCSSTVTLQNLGDQTMAAVIEAHKESGALVPLAGYAGMAIRLDPGRRVTYKLQIEEETANAWVKVRETIPASRFSSMLSIEGATECVAGNELHTLAREVSYPIRDPWFSGDVLHIRSEVLSVINTSEHAATASLCYSAGGLFSVPDETREPAELTAICASAFDVQIPPYGSRRFPVERAGNSHFSLKTRGAAIVLQMLRPVTATVNVYAVDSTVKFGGVASAK